MTDFDPDQPLETREAHDDYVRWCGDGAVETMQGLKIDDRPPYALVTRTAEQLFVTAVGVLRLDDDCDVDREHHLRTLAKTFAVARATERHRTDVGLREWLIARGVLDCYRATGRCAGKLLDSAKCALGVITLAACHPLVELGSLPTVDAFALLVFAWNELTTIADEDLSVDDFTVEPNKQAIDLMNWQSVNNTMREIGAPRMSPN